jgi:SPP1 gp7 family putative phage head morphogenesis protein
MASHTTWGEARDQMQRFNKACTLSTFRSAGVTKVKWVTVGDIRVRKSHKALNGQIFDVNNLPKEVDDYNCRCGLVPVEWAE